MWAHPHYPRPTQLSNPGYATDYETEKSPCSVFSPSVFFPGWPNWKISLWSKSDYGYSVLPIRTIVCCLPQQHKQTFVHSLFLGRNYGPHLSTRCRPTFWRTPKFLHMSPCMITLNLGIRSHPWGGEGFFPHYFVTKSSVGRCNFVTF